MPRTTSGTRSASSESAEPAKPAKKAPEPAGFEPETMGRPEDGAGLSRTRAEDGPDTPEGEVKLVSPERGAVE